MEQINQASHQYEKNGIRSTQQEVNGSFHIKDQGTDQRNDSTLTVTCDDESTSGATSGQRNPTGLCDITASI
ncbi:unnamed protein product [Arctogadus glacialis]